MLRILDYPRKIYMTLTTYPGPGEIPESVKRWTEELLEPAERLTWFGRPTLTGTLGSFGFQLTVTFVPLAIAAVVGLVGAWLVGWGMPGRQVGLVWWIAAGACWLTALGFGLLGLGFLAFVLLLLRATIREVYLLTDRRLVLVTFSMTTLTPRITEIRGISESGLELTPRWLGGSEVTFPTGEEKASEVPGIVARADAAELADLIRDTLPKSPTNVMESRNLDNLDEQRGDPGESNQGADAVREWNEGRPLSPKARAALRTALRTDESVVWACGQDPMGRITLTMLATMFYAILVGGCAALCMTVAYFVAPQAFWIIAPLVVVCAALIVVVWVMHFWHISGGDFYAITNQRAILREHGETMSFGKEALQGMQVSRNEDGSGTIIWERRRASAGDHLENQGQTEVGFHCVPAVDQVEEWLRSHLGAHRAEETGCQRVTARPCKATRRAEKLLTEYLDADEAVVWLDPRSRSLTPRVDTEELTALVGLIVALLVLDADWMIWLLVGSGLILVYLVLFVQLSARRRHAAAILTTRRLYLRPSDDRPFEIFSSDDLGNLRVVQHPKTNRGDILVREIPKADGSVETLGIFAVEKPQLLANLIHRTLACAAPDQEDHPKAAAVS
jgi:hypothetical protein